MCLPMSQMDAQYAATRATYAKPRHYRERLMAELAAGIAMRFGPLASLAAMHGTPNATVCCYNTWREDKGLIYSMAWDGSRGTALSCVHNHAHAYDFVWQYVCGRDSIMCCF